MVIQLGFINVMLGEMVMMRIAMIKTIVLLAISLSIFPSAVYALGDDPALVNTHGIPDFAANPTIVSTKSGNWFDASTWVEARIPGVNDVVKIAEGHVVVYKGINNNALSTLGIKGTLTFDTAANSRIKVGTILVYREGTLNVGTQLNPILENANVEIIIADKPLVTSVPGSATEAYDPLQYGTGIVGFGEVNFHGKAMPATWLRLLVEPLAGHTTLVTSGIPTDWNVGDTIILPGTKNEPIIRKYSKDPTTPMIYELEELSISSISGNVITLDQPLQYDHLGARDSDENVLALPHVGNVTRNITIRSEDITGTRGHILFTDRAKVDFRYVAMLGLGRTLAEPVDNTITVDGVVTHIGTNQIGRYPIHMHHHMGPINPTNEGYQFVITGTSVDDGAKWGIAVHNSHFGLIHNNVVYDVDGASIVTEEGNERGNVFSNNFAVKVGAPIKSWYNPSYGGVGGLNRPPLNFADFAYEGSAFWFTGNDNIVTGNVAANASFAGIMYNARSSGFAPNRPLVPKFRGAEIGQLSQWTNYAPRTPAPEVLLADKNEAYASAVGMWVGFANKVGTISNTLIWNVKQYGLYSQRNASANYDGLTIITDQGISNDNYRGVQNIGINVGQPTYQTGKVTFTNVRVEGFTLGIDLPTTVTTGSVDDSNRVTSITNGYLRNYVNVRDSSPRQNNKASILDNITFLLNDGPNDKLFSSTSASIITKFERPWRNRGILNLSQLLLKNYNKVPGDDYEVFFNEQGRDQEMPIREFKGTRPTDQNCPTDNLTNAECWAAHQVATLGRVATCNTALIPGIKAITCAGGKLVLPSALPPVVPPVLPPVVPPVFVVSPTLIQSVLDEALRISVLAGIPEKEALDTIFNQVSASQ